METTNNDKPGELTPRPWNLHPHYDGSPLAVVPQDGGTPWVAGQLYLAKDEMIIGEVSYQTNPLGWPTLTTPAQMKAHADFILRAVNSYDALVEALKAADKALDYQLTNIVAVANHMDDATGTAIIYEIAAKLREDRAAITATLGNIDAATS